MYIRGLSECIYFVQLMPLGSLSAHIPTDHIPEQSGSGSARGAAHDSAHHPSQPLGEREFFMDNLLVRIHFTNVMIRWTGLAPFQVALHLPSLHAGRQRQRSGCRS